MPALPRHALHLLPLAGLLFVATLPAARAGAVEEVDALARAYYAVALEREPVGLPQGKDLQQLASVLDPELLLLIERARQREIQLAAVAAPDEKPEMFEGDVLTGAYEGADEVELGPVQLATDGRSATVEARLFLVDERFPKASKHRVASWVDRLRLDLGPSGWRVGDVQLRVDVDPGRQDGLKAVLRGFGG